MNAALTSPPSTATHAASAANSERRVTRRAVVVAEWIKFRSVRSNLIALVASGVVLVVFGAMFSSLAGSGEALPPNATAGTDSLSMSFGGMNLSQLVLGVLGAVFVAGEYTTGLIRTMFAAVAGRVSILSAKAVVLGASSWIVMTIASFAVFFAGQAVYAGDGATYALTDPGVFRAVLGGGVYGAGVVLMGLALGFVLRSTAAAIGTLVVTLSPILLFRIGVLMHLDLGGQWLIVLSLLLGACVHASCQSTSRIAQTCACSARSPHSPSH